MFIENGFNVCVFCLGRAKLYKVMVHRLLFILSSIFLINNLLLISFFVYISSSLAGGPQNFQLWSGYEKTF